MLEKMIDIPIQEKRNYQTGYKPLDVFLSHDGGIVSGTAYMFTGQSGAGKTTISNYIMSGISTTEQRNVVFVSMEMSKEQAKKQFQGKIDFSNILIADAIPNNTFDGFLSLLDAIEQEDPALLVVDSLQAIADTTNAKTEDVIMAIIRFSKKTQCPSITITQNNKAGDFAGASKVLYYVDAHLEAVIDEKTNRRSLVYKKNRTGKVGITLPYKFDDEGRITFISDETKEINPLSEFAWYKAKETIELAFATIIKDEHKLIQKSVMPRLKITSNRSGNKHLPESDKDYHPGNNGFKFISDDGIIINTIFIDTEWSRNTYNSVNIDEIKQELSPYLNRYPTFERPHELFYLTFLIYMAFSLIGAKDNSYFRERKFRTDPKFHSLLDRLVANYS